MAKLLLTVWPFPTHLNPNLAVAHALRARGHEVAFYTDGSVAPLLNAEGFRCLPFRNVQWIQVRATMDQLLERTRRIGELSLWREFLLDSIPAQLADLDALFAEFQPDALMCDMAMWGPFLIWQEERRIPAAILCHIANCALGGRSRRIPGTTESSNLGNRLRTALTRVPANLISAQFRRAANRLRLQRKLAPIAVSPTDFGGSLPLYLMPSAPEFDDERSDLPASVHYMGPFNWDKAEPPPAWVRDLSQGYVLVEEGGLFTRASPLLTDAARTLDSLSLPSVVLLGDGRAPGTVEFGSLASNVRVENWTPLGPLLPRAGVMVTTGNSESVLAALLAGVPLVLVPSIWEQMDVAVHVESTGSGIRIPQGKCTPELLRAAIEKVIGDPSYRSNAQRLGKAMARRGGAARAAELIEKHLL